MAYTNIVAHNIATIRAARKEGASARAAKAAAKKETSLYTFLNTPTKEIKVTPPPALAANLWGDEEKIVEAAQPIAQDKSPELQMVERLCKQHEKGLFIKVKHPVRTDWMLLYSVINDLRETYRWSEDSISNWLQFAREW